jgi:hypothetical protein
LSFQQIQKYENGTNRISSGRLIQIVNTLQCSVTDLIGSGNNGPIKSTEISRYASSKEVVAIINAMASIPSSAVGRLVAPQRECRGRSFEGRVVELVIFGRGPHI